MCSWNILEDGYASCTGVFGLLPVLIVFFLNERLASLARRSAGLATGTILWALWARRILVGMPEGPGWFMFGAGG